MPSFSHIRRHSASTIASISNTFTSFCMPQRSITSSRAASTGKSLSAPTSVVKSIARPHAPMKVVKRQLHIASAKTFSYSGLFVTSFLIASLLPFQLAPTGGKGKGGGTPERRSRSRRERQDPDRHDMDSKSMASDSSAKTKQHRSSTVEGKPQIHANHRSGSSLRSSTHVSSYRPRRNGNSTLGGAGRSGIKERGSAGRASAKKQKDARMALRQQGWR